MIIVLFGCSVLQISLKWQVIENTLAFCKQEMWPGTAQPIRKRKITSLRLISWDIMVHLRVVQCLKRGGRCCHGKTCQETTVQLCNYWMCAFVWLCDELKSALVSARRVSHFVALLKLLIRLSFSFLSWTSKQWSEFWEKKKSQTYTGTVWQIPDLYYIFNNLFGKSSISIFFQEYPAFTATYSHSTQSVSKILLAAV